MVPFVRARHLVLYYANGNGIHIVARTAGNIPEEVESMATLELFDCSDNELSGQISWHDGSI